MPISIRCSYSARVQRRVRPANSGMLPTLRRARPTRQRPQFQTLPAPLRLAVDGAPGGGPAVEADLEVRDVGESHLAQHVRGERRALAARAVDDDALGGIDLARVV